MAVADACVHQLFETQASRTPDATAVIDDRDTLSYRRVDQRSSSLARELRQAGVQRGSHVGVWCPRSADMVVAVLGILKAGAAYVPLDPAHPRRHTDHVVVDAGIRVVVTGATDVPGMPAPPAAIAIPVPRGNGHAAGPAHNDPPSAQDALFVLYTSGSTGNPRGVISSHATITNRLQWAAEVYPYEPAEVACARTALGFVDSVAELFAPLACGVPLVIIEDAAQRDPTLMIPLLRRHLVSRIVMVPSLLTTLLELYDDLEHQLPSLRYWFLGGEPVPVPLVRAFKRRFPHAKLINIYGATELSGDATFYDFDHMPDHMQNAPIGVAIRGAHARVVDDQLRPVAPGETGHICVSGACLARGYLGRPEATAARFVANPFPEGGRLYHTGDLGRVLPTGDIEYLGRLDHQVKVRGTRVDLGAVEHHMACMDGVLHAAAIATADAGGRTTLVGFYTATDARQATPHAVRAYLLERLPEASVPTRLVSLDSFPATTNGKIDRRALAALAETSPRDASDMLHHLTPGEKRMHSIWSRVLDCDHLGVEDNFFDLGGHSLAAIRIAGALRHQLGRAVPVTAVFEHPTVARLAAHVDAGPSPARPGHVPPPVIASKQPACGVLPLAHAQFPFWFFRALTGDVPVVSEAFAFSNPVRVEQLRRAFADTVAAFDVLWMRFPRWSPTQRITRRTTCHLLVRDVRGSAMSPRAALQREADANNTLPFDLMRPPHVHARLVRLAGGDDRLLVCMPHVAADMRAMELFRKQLERCYAGAREPAMSTAGEPQAATASIGDLVAWERAPGHRGQRDADRRYWRRVAHGPAVNALPARLFEDAAAAGAGAAFHRRCIGPDEESKLAQAASRRRTTLPVLVASALSSTIANIAHEDTVSLLLALENRDADAVGELFTNMASMMPIVVEGARHAAPGALVTVIHDQVTASYDHIGHMMRQPTCFNDFWTGSPRPLQALLARASGWLARRWRHAHIDEDVVAECVRAAVPLPPTLRWHAPHRRLPHGARQLLVVLNILPEVYAPPPGKADPDDDRTLVVRRRGMELLLPPADRTTGADRLLDRTLQVHVSRDGTHNLTINCYGGGMHPRGLSEIAQRMVDTLGALSQA